MANKTVENPCVGSGKPFMGDPITVKVGFPTMEGNCSECGKRVTINKTNRMTRKHWAMVGDTTPVDVSLVAAKEEQYAL
jgi:hypothetical protein